MGKTKAVGPATNAASMTLIARARGNRFGAIYIGTISFFSVVAGYILNALFSSVPATLFPTSAHRHVTGGLSWPTIFFLIFLLMLSLYRKYGKRPLENLLRILKLKRFTRETRSCMKFSIKAMTCNHCARHVRESIEKVHGVSFAEVDVRGGAAKVYGTFNQEDVRAAVKSSGYAVGE